MTYISSDGKVYNKQPWGISRLLAIFFGMFAAIIMFIKTLITPFTNPNGSTSSDRGSGSWFPWGRGGGSGGGGSGGGGGGSGGMGPPRPPRRPMGRINHTPSVSFPGGCAGGSCGR